MDENIELQKIDLQNKTSAKEGKIEIFEFEKEEIGLQKTIFHRMFIPLEAFNSSFGEAIETKIFIDWLNLNLRSAINLDGLNLKTTPKDDSQVTIHLGDKDNPCDIDTMKIKKVDENLYDINCTIFIEFQHEKIAQNEFFHFKTQLRLNPTIYKQTTK